MEIKHLVHYYYYDYITIIVFSSSALLTDGKKKTDSCTFSWAYNYCATMNKKDKKKEEKKIQTIKYINNYLPVT